MAPQVTLGNSRAIPAEAASIRASAEPESETEASELLESIMGASATVDVFLSETHVASPGNLLAALDADLTDAGVSAIDRSNRIKATGVCPWSGCACARAPRCTMTATDACNNLVRRRVKNCGTCSNNGSCDELFICFLDVRDAEAAARR